MASIEGLNERNGKKQTSQGRSHEFNLAAFNMARTNEWPKATSGGGGNILDFFFALKWRILVQK